MPFFTNWPLTPAKPLDFKRIKTAALGSAPAILRRFLPDGKVVRNEYVARNPKRADRRTGSFKINVVTGRWADFATGDKGGDLISLVAYLEDLSQGQAARLLAQMLGIDPEVQK